VIFAEQVLRRRTAWFWQLSSDVIGYLPAFLEKGRTALCGPAFFCVGRKD
jgi:hypothetical protein